MLNSLEINVYSAGKVVSELAGRLPKTLKRILFAVVTQYLQLLMDKQRAASSQTNLALAHSGE